MRYFINTLNQVHDLEQQIKNKKTKTVFQVVIREGSHIKRFTWFMLQLNLSFERKPLGSGIAIFYMDLNKSFFLENKE